jgi:GTP-binding protein
MKKNPIISARYVISSATHKQCPPANKPEYAFIGRSNVGKSSLINMITGQTKLAKISATPGKTQLINHFEIQSANKKFWNLVDLPGYGYAATVGKKARNNWGNMIESYIRKRENLVTLFVLVDSRHEPQKIDLEFINQLGEWQVPFVVVFTKTDKNKPGGTKNRVEAFKQALLQSWQFLPQFFITSSEKGEGREEILAFIEQLNAEFKLELPGS